MSTLKEFVRIFEKDACSVWLTSKISKRQKPLLMCNGFWLVSEAEEASLSSFNTMKVLTCPETYQKAFFMFVITITWPKCCRPLKELETLIYVWSLLPLKYIAKKNQELVFLHNSGFIHWKQWFLYLLLKRFPVDFHILYSLYITLESISLIRLFTGRVYIWFVF